MRWLAISCVLWVGCGDDDGPVDSGTDTFVRADAGSDAANDSAADTRQDARADVGAPDLGFDAGPECICPTLPATCEGVVTDPTFSPDDPGFGLPLMQLLACSEVSVHAALYDTSWPCIVEAFQAKLEIDEDITFEIVVDDDNCRDTGVGRGCALDPLAAHPRVSIRDDGRSALMHHKFVIGDNTRVWVSSANMTQNSFCSESNNAVVIEESDVVGGYEAAFQRMFTDETFGPVSPEPPILGGVYALYFSPQSPIEAPPNWFMDMIGEIDASTVSIEAMIFALTRTEVATALINAHTRGVAVRVMTAPRFGGEAAIGMLSDAGIPVRLSDVHHKVLITDSATVITGSANWSANAWKNNENSLWIGDAPTAETYRSEFDAMWEAAE